MKSKSSFNTQDSSSSDSYDSESYEDTNSEEEYLKGEIINNKYLIIHEIGSGSFATVWLSYNILNSKLYIFIY